MLNLRQILQRSPLRRLDFLIHPITIMTCLLYHSPTRPVELLLPQLEGAIFPERIHHLLPLPPRQLPQDSQLRHPWIRIL